ncbi:MAG: TIR domain-containing protein [Pseudomonadota bacterium]
MPDIFLSYSRDDQIIARRFAEGFGRAGLSVWWDATLTAGEAYDQVTEKALQDAKAVVVLWSKKSVDSRWVRAEATQALDAKTLVPVMIEPCKRPIMFELTHTADLSRWTGDASDPAWQAFIAGLGRFIVSPQSVVGSRAVMAGTPTSGRRGLITAVVAILCLAVVAGAAWKFWPRHAELAQPVAAQPVAAQEASIAVLPFVNMSSDKEQEFFADGLSEELLNQLAQVPKLRVIGRTSSFAFKGKNEDLRKIGEVLGVNHILEGSVRKSGNSLRITAQLIEATNGSHLWSETYDRELKNVFAIQDEIARAVTEKLRLTISAGGKKGGTQNVAAYEEYLVGLSKLKGALFDEVMDSVKHLERATSLDPGFDDAWSALLDANFAVINVFPEQRAAAQRRVDAIMDRALDKAPDSRAANVARGVRAVQRKDYATALDIRRGLAESSNGGDSFLSYGSLLLVLGHPREAAEAFGKARLREPLDSSYTIMKQISHEMAGQNQAAEEEYQRALTASNPNRAVLEGSALVQAMGVRDRATIDRLLPRAIEAGGPAQIAINGAALKYLDDAPAARREFHRLIDEPSFQGDVFGMAAVAVWAAYFGDAPLALDALQRTARSNAAFESWGISLWRPVMQPVRRLAGFKDLLRDQGLVDYWRKSGNWGEFCKPVGANDFECS